MKLRELHTDSLRLLAFTFDLSHRESHCPCYSMYRTGEETLRVFISHWLYH